MIPVGPLAENAQSEIHFGRGGKLAVARGHGRRPRDHGSGRIGTPAGGDRLNMAGERAGLRSTVRNRMRTSVSTCGSQIASAWGTGNVSVRSLKSLYAMSTVGRP